ncbi:MAG TPA: hypothetical protein VMJ32_07275 [Pirellulales bacterium]|nr:hypothetical protein [Pirellulales bacterium]
MTISRLSTVSKELDGTINKVASSKRMSISLAIAAWAVDQTGLSHPVLPNDISSAQPNLVQSLVEELDEAYFTLQESAEAGTASEEEVTAAFSLARAANAVEFALQGDLSETAYEAVIATDDLPGLQHLVERLLLQNPSG